MIEVVKRKTRLAKSLPTSRVLPETARYPRSRGHWIVTGTHNDQPDVFGEVETKAEAEQLLDLLQNDPTWAELRVTWIK